MNSNIYCIDFYVNHNLITIITEEDEEEFLKKNF